MFFHSLTVIGRQLINCAFARGRRCARLIIRYGRRYLERIYMRGVWQWWLA